MKSIFNPTSYRQIHINGYPYMFHENILKKMSIFSAMFDDSIDQQNINLEIIDYDMKLLDNIFLVLHGQEIIYVDSALEININRLKLMMYLGMDQKLVDKYVKYLANIASMIDYIINMFVCEQYHECMNIILDGYLQYIDPNNIMKNINGIKKTSYSLPYKINFVNRLVYKSFNVGRDSVGYFYNIGVSGYLLSYDSSYSIELIYKKYGIDAKGVDDDGAEKIRLNISNHIAGMLCGEF